MAEIKTLGSRGYIKEGHDIVSFQVGSTINQPIEGLYNTYNPYSNPDWINIAQVQSIAEEVRAAITHAKKQSNGN